MTGKTEVKTANLSASLSRQQAADRTATRRCIVDTVIHRSTGFRYAENSKWIFLYQEMMRDVIEHDLLAADRVTKNGLWPEWYEFHGGKKKNCSSELESPLCLAAGFADSALSFSDPRPTP